MRAYLRDIFAEAVDQDFLTKDPARKVKVPTQLRETDTTTLTWDQLGLALTELTLRDRILLELDMTNALRPSELLELPKLTFQVIRRTNATLARKKGTVEDVQGVMRHSRTATTIDVYMHEIPESVQATVNSTIGS